MDARAKTLLAESEAFEFFETVVLCCTAGRRVRLRSVNDKVDLLDSSVLQQWLLNSMMGQGSFGVRVAFKLPSIFSLVV